LRAEKAFIGTVTGIHYVVRASRVMIRAEVVTHLVADQIRLTDRIRGIRNVVDSVSVEIEVARRPNVRAANYATPIVIAFQTSSRE